MGESLSNFVAYLRLAYEMLHEMHVNLIGGADFFVLHEKLGDWYKKMYDYFDSFYEWSIVFNTPYVPFDNGDTQAYQEKAAILTARKIIDGVMMKAVAVLKEIGEPDDPYYVGLKSDLEGFCAYWSKVSGYMLTRINRKDEQ